MKVVVTGATGHLGQYVVHALLARGDEVVAVSRSGKKPPVPFGEKEIAGAKLAAVAADLEKDESVDVLAKHLGPDVALVHLAAWHPPATASTSPKDRDRLIAANVFGTMRALEAAKKAKVACVVYSSTFEVYGEPPEGDIAEETRTHPITDYGATKLSGEHHLKAFSQEEKIRTVALRMPAIYGPGETTSRALPNFLRAVAAGETPTIQGDGGDVRDQLHAKDATRAVLLAIDRDVAGTFCIDDGARHSIRDVATTAMKVAGASGEPRALPRAKPRRDYHMSIERARRELGFEPMVSLEDGMADELRWMKRAEETAR